MEILYEMKNSINFKMCVLFIKLMDKLDNH